MSARKKAASNRNRQKVSSKANYELAQLANENAKKAMVLTTDACNLRTELEEQAFELKVQCISSLMNRVKLKMAMKANPPPVGMTTKSKLRRKSLPKKKSDDECAELLEPFKKALALQEEKVKIAKITKTLVNNETKQFHERYALHTANADKIIFSEEAIQQRVAARLKKLAEKKANLDELVRTLNNEHTPSVEPEEIQESVKPKRTRTEKPVAVKAKSIPVESPIVIESGDETYCYCNRISFGRMVACDNPACKIEWFHFDCVGLTEEPVGAWFCRECHQSNAPPPGKRPRGRPRKNPLPLPTTSNFILPPRSPTKDLQHVPEVTIRVSPKTLDSFQPTLKKRVSKPTRRLLL